MLKKEKIIKSLQKFNIEHKDEGFVFISIFGSYARNENDIFSDIDLTYKINHDKFCKNDAFAKLLKIEEIKKTLEESFHKRIDLIPANTQNMMIKENIEAEQVFI